MPKAIGIDLGTTNSAMAIFEAGEARIIENSEGNRTTPSVVAVNPKSGERFVGALARRQAVTNPDNTVFSAKRFIGRRFESPHVKDQIDRVPFKLRALPNGDAGIQLSGKLHAPPEISAMVLRKLKEDAEAKLGDKVTQAVITVPAYFDDSQREATKVAGKIAGLEVLRIINEPTAASLAYGLDKNDKKQDQAIAVYDLGGGTFDITILQLGEGVFEVKSTNGDTYLGGDDFDTRVVDYIADEFKKENGIDLRQDVSAHQRLRVEAERSKIELSNAAQTEINLPFITADASGPKHLIMTLTRAKLEELTMDLVQKTIAPSRQAIKDSGVSPSDIAEVVLVGGMTRMPLVIETVKELFNKEPNRSINPDEVVALGAAIQAGVLQGDVKDVLLLDVTPLTLGLETLGGIRTALIERNTTIPTSKTETFTTAADNQSSVEVHVMQGEREMAKDNISIGRFMLDGIQPAPRGIPKVEVTFDIDADGILKVSAKDQSTGKEQHITITGRSGLGEDEVERFIRESEQHSAEDQNRKEQAEARNLLESGIYAAEKVLSDQGENAPDEAKSELEGKIQEGKILLQNQETDTTALRSSLAEIQTSMQKLSSSSGTPGQASPSSKDDKDKGGDSVEGEFREL